MSKKKRLLPELPLDPLEALESFDSVLTGVQNVVDTLDGRLGQIDMVTSEIDKKYRSTDVSRFVERAKPKEHSRLSYEGQSELDYCVECAVKHSQTAKVLMREALQRAEASSPSAKGVQEKVRGVVEELVGMEDDTDTVKNEKVSTLNSLARSLRKFIYVKEAEVGGARIEDLREIKDMVDKLVDATYQIRVSEQCIGCTVEELCGGNVECVEFVEKAAKNVKDPEEFRNIIRQAREKYGRG